MSDVLTIRPVDETRWDVVSLGEIMLRLDPGEGRVRTTRQFRVWEGGGEYNVARALHNSCRIRSFSAALKDAGCGALTRRGRTRAGGRP